MGVHATNHQQPPCMPTRIPPEKFLVAFSLAGEERDFVRGIAEAVEQQLDPDTVFYSEESGTQLARLQALRVVERFPARGDKAINVHEASRLALRTSLANDAAERFRAWSARAAAYWAADPSAAGRIEWIYHLLTSDPDRGASELESLDRRWSSEANPEDRYALAAALGELETAGRLQGRARVWVLLVIAWTRASRSESSQLTAVARQTLRLARAATDPRAEAEAQCLLGDALQAQGKLTAAQAAFAEYLAISRRLAGQDPSNAGWQQDLAVAHSRVGGVLQAQGELTAAQAAFAEYLAISRRLAGQDPSNAGWQRELAVASWWQAELHMQRGNPQMAVALYEDASRILRAMTEKAPHVVQWASDREAVDDMTVGGARPQVLDQPLVKQLLDPP